MKSLPADWSLNKLVFYLLVWFLQHLEAVINEFREIGVLNLIAVLWC